MVRTVTEELLKTVLRVYGGAEGIRNVTSVTWESLRLEATLNVAWKSVLVVWIVQQGSRGAAEGASQVSQMNSVFIVYRTSPSQSRRETCMDDLRRKHKSYRAVTQNQHQGKG